MALMYNERSRRLSEDGEVLSYAIRQNPILSTAAGAVLIAGCCTTLGNAVVLSIIMLIMLPLIGFISAVEMERFQPERRYAAYCAIAAGAVFLISFIVDNIVIGCVEALGIFAPLVAVNSLVLARTSEDAPILTRREAVVEGVACAIIFMCIALPVGLVRELLGSGSIGGGWLGFNGNSVFNSPFAGFILCGFAIAIIRKITDKPERINRAEEGEK